MKFLKSTLSPALAIIFMLIIVLFSSCSKDFNPRAPEDDPISEIAKTQNNLQFLSYGKVLPSLKKTILVTKFIEEGEGGSLKLKYKIDTETGKVKVEIKLKIHKDSFPGDAEIAMSIDDKTFLADLDMLFGPSGLDFTKPANLNVAIEGIDLSGVDPASINIYYFNKQTKLWEIMDSKKVKIDVKKNKIKIEKAELPHFSRYALCKG